MQLLQSSGLRGIEMNLGVLTESLGNSQPWTNDTNCRPLTKCRLETGKKGGKTHRLWKKKQPFQLNAFASDSERKALSRFLTDARAHTKAQAN